MRIYFQIQFYSYLYVYFLVSDCKEKWRNIRGRFLRQIKDQPPSGSGMKKKKKEYYLNEYLHFIEPFTKSRCQTGNLQPQENSDDGSEIDVQNEDLNDDIGASVICPEIITNKRKKNNNDMSMKKNKNTSSLDELNKVASSYFMAKKISKDKIEENDDPDMNFLKSLLPDIKMLNPQAKRILKMDMMKLVHDANEQMLKSQVYQERAYQPPYNFNQPGNMLYQPQEIIYSPTDTNETKNNQNDQEVQQPTY